MIFLTLVCLRVFPLITICQATMTRPQGRSMFGGAPLCCGDRSTIAPGRLEGTGRRHGGRQTARLPGLSVVLRKTNLHFQRYPAVHREADAVAADGQDQSVPLVVRQVGAAEAPVLRGHSVTSEKEVQAFSWEPESQDETSAFLSVLRPRSSTSVIRLFRVSLFLVVRFHQSEDVLVSLQSQ